MQNQKQKKRLIIGNWKMNPWKTEDARKIFDAVKKEAGKLSHVQTVVCPPFVFLSDLSRRISGHRVVLGAQDVFYEMEGAHTGEVSPLMLASVGAKYAIIGHSERRALGETDEGVNKKVLAALKMGLTAVLCVGEKERDAEGGYLSFVKNQIETALVKVQKRSLVNVIVAYEPVWAIGAKATGADTPADFLEMTLFIRKTVSDMFDRTTAQAIPVLCGGSVDEKNAESFLKEGEADGLLVGRASLSSEQFIKILKIANVVHWVFCWKLEIRN
ncbi:MAG: triose-phosphate isomerase [Parcubacteria group bacterium]|nr:triose-phosphate isomerase [Parcubacteria group bacterium]